VIAKITGTLAAIDGSEAVLLEHQGLSYEVYVPAAAMEELAGQVGKTVTLHTMYYLEGSVGGGNLFPRLIGFTSRADKDFFDQFVRVKGLGIRRALKAFAAPASAIALAIEQGDESFLSRLPEIGKRTAGQLVATLKGKLERFTVGAEQGVETASLQEYQLLALEIMLQLGERRGEALELIEQVARRHPELTEPGAVVEAAYRLKTVGSV